MGLYKGFYVLLDVRHYYLDFTDGCGFVVFDILIVRVILGVGVVEQLTLGVGVQEQVTLGVDLGGCSFTDQDVFIDG